VPNDGKYYLEEAKRLSKKSKVFLLYKIDPKGPCLSQCIEPWIGPFIDPRGDVYPCNFLGTWTVLNQPVTLWYDETSLKINVDNFKLGNIMNQDLDEIWNSKKIFKLRKNIAKFENQDKRRNWNGESYIKLIFTRQNILDEMLNFCEVCPFRFGITH
jgi:MoaA/NifB/PqqE/SkfB family radical SAM enzyme